MSHPPAYGLAVPGVTEIGFGGSGGFGAVSPGTTGGVATTPAAADSIVIPYLSSVVDRICVNAALSFAYSAVAVIRVLSAVARFLACCSTSAVVDAPSLYFFCYASRLCAAYSRAACAACTCACI